MRHNCIGCNVIFICIPYRRRWKWFFINFTNYSTDRARDWSGHSKFLVGCEVYDMRHTSAEAAPPRYLLILNTLELQTIKKENIQGIQVRWSWWPCKRCTPSYRTQHGDFCLSACHIFYRRGDRVNGGQRAIRTTLIRTPMSLKWFERCCHL
jgi:hypothetical protein